MNVKKITEINDIKEIILKMSDCISELETLIENVDVLSEEMYTGLVNQIDSLTEKEECIPSRSLEVYRIKTGMIRDFIIRANEKINGLSDLSDKSISATR